MAQLRGTSGWFGFALNLVAYKVFSATDNTLIFRWLAFHHGVIFAGPKGSSNILFLASLYQRILFVFVLILRNEESFFNNVYL